jgi:hypothetical protein
MLSTNSLSAFSGAASTPKPLQPSPVRPVREQRETNPVASASLLGKQALPGGAPPGITPRGSLLNLSI